MYIMWGENMNTKALHRWKECQRAKAEELVAKFKPKCPEDIRKIYPEFTLRGAYTTSLEPYVPIWLLLPFFERIIVGIVPHLKTEEEFHEWYGVSIKQLLDLREKGRVEIRVLFPRSLKSTPQYLDPFFSGEFPSSARDLALDTALLGNDRLTEIRNRFSNLVAKSRQLQSIDGLIAHTGRAYNIAQVAYIQLHALRHEEAAVHFEKLISRDVDRAFHWLELCRLFLVGPIHYSLGGIHCVSSSVPSLKPLKENNAIAFPADLGRILIDTFEMVRMKPATNKATLDHCIQTYHDYEKARETLIALDTAIKNGRVKQSIKQVDDLKSLLSEARSSKEWWLRIMRLVTATGLSIATLPLVSVCGLLVGLGFEVLSELPTKPIDSALETIARSLHPPWAQNHITLPLDLEASMDSRQYKHK